MLKSNVPLRVVALALGIALLAPLGAWAQQTGQIAGLATDATGGVLPGVTVEVRNPALIEFVRVAVTDGNGRYQLINLVPGDYTVTFTFPGFGTVIREGISLNSGITANVGVELSVSAIEESVTVSGAAPTVDVQNVSVRTVITREIVDTLPTGKQYTGLVTLIPGVVTSAPGGPISQDVGGATGMTFTNAQIHGGREEDGAPRINGMSVASITSQGNARSNLQDANVEEYNMQLGSAPAEFPYGGIYYNAIPKSGGNEYSGNVFLSGTQEAWQKDNLGDLADRGLKHPNKIRKIFDFSPAFGGPIVRDRMWFFMAGRDFVTDSFVPGLYINKDPAAFIYEVDPTERAVSDTFGNAVSLNLTFQANAQNRITGFYNWDFQCYCHFGINGGTSPEAVHRMTAQNNLFQGIWTSAISSRILIEVAASRYRNGLPRGQEPEATESSITDIGIGIRYRSNNSYATNDAVMSHYRASISYVTGSHALKVGFESERQYADDSDFLFGSQRFTFLNGAPLRVIYDTKPYDWESNMDPTSFYIQDQWTVNRLTANIGLRYDQFNSSYPASLNPPTRFVSFVRDYPGADVFGWKDLSPRMGMAWDVTGDGSWAIKASLNRYIQQEGKIRTAYRAHPVRASTNSVTRSWTDTNGDFVPDGDFFNPDANGEIGPSPDVAFGRPRLTQIFDDDWRNGYGTRPHNWEGTVSVDHDFNSIVSMHLAYVRRSYGNFIVNDNTLIDFNDFDQYSITAPLDSRLPGGGGNVISDLYDIDPAKRGQVLNRLTRSEEFGNRVENWQGVDILLAARANNGAMIQGGVSSGRHLTDMCDVVVNMDNPSTYNCHRESPYLTQVKFFAAYPLPGDFRLSAVFQHVQLDPTNRFRPTSAQQFGMSANYVATNAEIAPSLGRNLSNGVRGTVGINIIEQNPALYLDKVNQLDLRLAKSFNFGGTRLEGLFDLYNVTNGNPVMQYNTAYGRTGANWMLPRANLPGRMMRLGVQLNF